MQTFKRKENTVGYLHNLKEGVLTDNQKVCDLVIWGFGLPCDELDIIF